VLDGMVIDSPEAVIEHLEKIAFPQLEKAKETFDEEKTAKEIRLICSALCTKTIKHNLKTIYLKILWYNHHILRNSTQTKNLITSVAMKMSVAGLLFQLEMWLIKCIFHLIFLYNNLMNKAVLQKSAQCSKQCCPVVIKMKPVFDFLLTQRC